MAELEQVLSAEIAARRGGSKRVTASIESLGDSERIAQAESKRLIEAAVKQINTKIRDVDTKVGCWRFTLVRSHNRSLMPFFTYSFAHLLTCSIVTYHSL